MLDEVNADSYHMIPKNLSDISDVFPIGTLVKFDFDHAHSNIQDFVEMEMSKNYTMTEIQSKSTEDMLKEKKTKKRKTLSYLVAKKWTDPLFIKIVGARRIKLDSMINKHPFFYANIQHLQPQIDEELHTNVTDTEIDTEVIPKMDKLNESESEIKLRSSFNIATEILRNLYNSDPDNRREMLKLWSARHSLDIGFFCDFAGSMTNSTPRELQALLESINYSTRLQYLIQMLKREEKMMLVRDEIISDVESVLKQEKQGKYLSMIMNATTKRMAENGYLVKRAVAAPPARVRTLIQEMNDDPEVSEHIEQIFNTANSTQANVQQPNNRYGMLAAKYMKRIELKILHPEAKEIFDEGIDKLVNHKRNDTNIDLETTKQYMDWISSLPWNTYSIDNGDIIEARAILDKYHYGMKQIKDRILEIIACNILRGDCNLNEKYGTSTFVKKMNIDQKKEKESESENIISTEDKFYAEMQENRNTSKILCLIGPPGVGKTSIGECMAKALHRRFYKFSLGGTEDSQLLKGFLRTYASSQPGKIVYGLKQCRTSNPLILIDEIDKIGSKHSDPSSALLEILDPAQNKSFVDNYLDFPIDLSKVLFVCTANDESKINPILKDRLFVVRLSGYDDHEKIEIAKRYLIPKVLEKCGLRDENVQIMNEVIEDLVKWYAREAGVRSLEQNIERICNKVSLEFVEEDITFDDIQVAKENQSLVCNDKNLTTIASSTKASASILDTFSNFIKRLTPNSNQNTTNVPLITASSSVDDEVKVEVEDDDVSYPHKIIDSANLRKYIGPRKHQSDRTYEDEKSTPVGVVTGLAYTNYGGCTNYIETVKYKKKTAENEGSGANAGIKCTGQLGNVMTESVQIAYCVAQSILHKLDERNHFFDDYHIHLHCPEGGIAKDGPSAGVGIATALFSLALDEKISPDLAMTGEITLTGKILKIGGLKEKCLAAKRANIKQLIIPHANEEEFYDDEFGVPEYLRTQFEDVHFVKHFDEVLNILFEDFVGKQEVKRNMKDFVDEDNELSNMPKVLSPI